MIRERKDENDYKTKRGIKRNKRKKGWRADKKKKKAKQRDGMNKKEK